MKSEVFVRSLKISVNSPRQGAADSGSAPCRYPCAMSLLQDDTEEFQLFSCGPVSQFSQHLLILDVYGLR